METKMNHPSRIGKNRLAIIAVLLIFTHPIYAEGTPTQHVAQTEVDPILNYIVWAIAFIITLFVFSYYKQKEERKELKKQNQNYKSAHFARYSKHREVPGLMKSKAISS